MPKESELKKKKKKKKSQCNYIHKKSYRIWSQFPGHGKGSGSGTEIYGLLACAASGHVSDCLTALSTQTPRFTHKSRQINSLPSTRLSPSSLAGSGGRQRNPP